MATQMDELAEFAARELRVPDTIYLVCGHTMRTHPPGSIDYVRAQRTKEFLETLVLYNCRNANT